MLQVCTWLDREVRMEPEIIIKEMETELKDIVARPRTRATGVCLFVPIPMAMGGPNHQLDKLHK